MPGTVIFDLVGSEEINTTWPNYSMTPIVGTYTGQAISPTALRGFVDAMDGYSLCALDVAAPNEELKAAITARARELLANAPEAVRNEIADVLVWPSRPSGEPTVWKKVKSYFIHPVAVIATPTPIAYSEKPAGVWRQASVLVARSMTECLPEDTPSSIRSR